MCLIELVCTQITVSVTVLRRRCLRCLLRFALGDALHRHHQRQAESVHRDQADHKREQERHLG